MDGRRKRGHSRRAGRHGSLRSRKAPAVTPASPAGTPATNSAVSAGFSRPAHPKSPSEDRTRPEWAKNSCDTDSVGTAHVLGNKQEEEPSAIGARHSSGPRPNTATLDLGPEKPGHCTAFPHDNSTKV